MAASTPPNLTCEPHARSSFDFNLCRGEVRLGSGPLDAVDNGQPPIRKETVEDLPLLGGGPGCAAVIMTWPCHYDIELSMSYTAACLRCRADRRLAGAF